MTKKIGIDISRWQGRWNMGEHVIVPDFAILRVGYGTMPDKAFDTFHDAGVASDVDLGGYHYFSSGSPWQTQVDFFVDRVKGKKIKKFALDVETAYNNMSRDFALCAVKWIQAVQDATGVETVLYTNPYTYRDHLRAHTAAVDDLKLWVAQYPSNSWTKFVQNIRETLSGKPWMEPTGRGADDWWAWQFTDKAPGKEYGVDSASIDLDILNGDQEFVGDDLPIEDVPVEEIAPLLLNGELDDYLVEVIINARRK